MQFNIKKLELDAFVTSSTENLSQVVCVVEYEFIESVNGETISKSFAQPLEFRGWDSSSFIQYNNLTEEKVKGWVTSSFETLKTETYTMEDDVHHPTGSWSAYLNSMSSSLYNQVSGSGLPW